MLRLKQIVIILQNQIQVMHLDQMNIFKITTKFAMLLHY